MFFKQIKHSIFTSILKGGLKIKNCYSTENLILFVGSNLISVSECMSCAWKPLILFFELKVIHHYQILSNGSLKGISTLHMCTYKRRFFNSIIFM